MEILCVRYKYYKYILNSLFKVKNKVFYARGIWEKPTFSYASIGLVYQ